MAEYWRTIGFNGQLADLELRAQIALTLVERFGAVAGKRGPEAGAEGKGDPGLDLQTPEELVERCFTIADLFVAKAEERGSIKAVDLVAEKERSEAANEDIYERISLRRQERAKARTDKAGV